MFDGTTIEANQARMESARSGFDGMREELAALLLPHHDHFHHAFAANSAPRTDTPFDEYAALSMQDGVAAFEGFTMPRGQKWQGITIADKRLLDNVANAQWLEAVRDRIFDLRHDPKSGFVGAIHETVESLYAFGEASIWPDARMDDRGVFEGFSYQAEPIYTVWVEVDAQGNPMRIHRKLTLTADQAWREWDEDCPPKVLAAYRDRNRKSDQGFVFLHVIERNPRVMPGRIDAAGMPWRACYYSYEDKMPFRVGGYRVLRRITPRWRRAASKHYGTGPSRLVLGAIRAAQLMMQDRVLGTELAVKRPMLADDDELDAGLIDLSPFGITMGGLENGRRKLEPLFDGAELQGAEALHGEVRSMIDRAFYRHLMQINREMKTHIAATRTLEEIAEKGVLLAPLARQEKELFAPLLDAELELARQHGLLDDMPPQLREYFAAGNGVQAMYDNELSRMIAAAEAAGYFRMSEQVVVMGQYAPEAIEAFTREYPPEKVVAALGQVNGVPARWRATEEERAARDEAKAEQMAMQQMLELAPALSQAGKNIAEAEAIGNGP
jgi:hypothetical protein